MPDELLTGTPFSDPSGPASGNPANGPSQLFDGDSGTWYISGDPNGYAGLEFAEARVISQITFQGRQYFGPGAGNVFEGSNTSQDVGYALLATTTGANYGDYGSFVVTDPAAYKWVRYRDTQGHQVNLTEIQVFGHSASTAATPPATPLAIGPARLVSTTSTQISLAVDAPTGGTAPVGLQWYRILNAAGLTAEQVTEEGDTLGLSSAQGATTTNLTDTPPDGQVYAYVCQAEDAASQFVYSPILTAQRMAAMAEGGTLNQADLDNIATLIAQKLAGLNIAGLNTAVGAVQERVNAVPTTAQIAAAVPSAAQIAAAVPHPADVVTALKADAAWQQLVAQVTKIYGAEWGNLVKQPDGSYNVLSPGGTTVIGNVHNVYATDGTLAGSTKTLS